MGTWKAFIELYRAGRIRAIGVSNFKPYHLESLVKSEIVPMVNQIEIHPGMLTSETIEYCRGYDMLIEAWSPLGSGALLGDELLAGIAEKYGKSVAQICLRWCLQQGTLPLPKSVTPERIEANTKIFDFELSDDDMTAMSDMENIGFSGFEPDEVDF